MGRFVGEPITNWGNYVNVKVNAADLFKKEIAKLQKKGGRYSILLSSVTDPYQGLEKKYALTQKILNHIVESDYSGLISILTKSSLVTRDLTILKKIRHAEVGLTITTTDDQISRFLETHAPNTSKRLQTLKELNENGIRTYAFLGPVLPHYLERKDDLENLMREVKKTGTKEVYVEHVNLSTYVRQRLKPLLQDKSKAINDMFAQNKNKTQRRELNELILKLIEKYDLKLRLGSPIAHNEL
jgi:DNA repair photolyase